MRRALYKRWRDHDLRHLLREAEQGEHIHADVLDDLRLPPKVRKATEQAIAKVQTAAKNGEHYGILRNMSDELSAVLVDSLPEHHETAEQFLKRRRSLGDPDAAARLKAVEQVEDEQAAEIQREAQVRADRPGQYDDLNAEAKR